MLPTPTALPPAVSQLTALHGSDWTIWHYTDEAIQVWNYYPNLGLIIQISVIIVIIVAFVILLTRLIQGYMSDGESQE